MREKKKNCYLVNWLIRLQTTPDDILDSGVCSQHSFINDINKLIRLELKSIHNGFINGRLNGSDEWVISFISLTVGLFTFKFRFINCSSNGWIYLLSFTSEK